MNIADIPNTIVVPYRDNSRFQFTIADPCTGRPYIIVSYYYWNSAKGRDSKGELILVHHWGPLTYHPYIPNWYTFRPWKESGQI